MAVEALLLVGDARFFFYYSDERSSTTASTIADCGVAAHRPSSVFAAGASTNVVHIV